MLGLSSNNLNRLVTEIDEPYVASIALGGICVREDAAEYSDIDIARFVLNVTDAQRKRFFYIGGQLVSVATKAIPDILADLGRPQQAIWVVPGLSCCRVLLDKDGSVTRLMPAVAEFDWQMLQGSANEYASYSVAQQVEQVHKLMNEILRDNDLGVSYAVAKLLRELTETVAVQRGVLIKSDTTYYHQVQQSVGLTSAWAGYHRIAIGVGEIAPAGRSDVPASIRMTGVATLHLCKKTVALLQPYLLPGYLGLVDQA